MLESIQDQLIQSRHRGPQNDHSQSRGNARCCGNEAIFDGGDSAVCFYAGSKFDKNRFANHVHNAGPLQFFIKAKVA
jgi:hypothetical protein